MHGMNDFLILGSGPTASIGADFANNDRRLKVACVNGSGALLDSPPTAYGLFEQEAAEYYAQTGRNFAKQGTKLFVTNGLSARFFPEEDVFAMSDPWSAKINLSKRFKAAAGISGNVTTYGLGIGSAALMMYLVAEHYRPDNIYVAGVDGYTVDGYYADGIKKAPFVHELNDEVVRISNIASSLYLGSVTQHFTDINFYWFGQPNHPLQEDWNVSYMVPMKEAAGV